MELLNEIQNVIKKDILRDAEAYIRVRGFKDWAWPDLGVVNQVYAGVP